jgi:Putative zinc-finger
MTCDRTEQISLLVDGELARAEAEAVEAHLAGCEGCRAARAEFLFLRQQLNSYTVETNPAAQRRALASILSSKPAAAARGESSARGRREGLLAAFGLTPLRPAMAASLALVLLAAIGLTLFINSRRETPTARQTPGADDGGERAQATASPAAVTPSPTPAGVTPDEHDVDESRGGGDGLGNPSGAAAVEGSRRKARRRSPRPRGSGESQTVAARVEPSREPSAVAQPPTNEGAAAGSAASREVAAGLTGAGLDTSRHVEQAQSLLRSFRNARGDDDLAHERERSKRLLYRNIVLRREAASKGDPVVASVLGRLEPILLDIANLPDSPAREEVNSIRERVRKKNLVVMLQAGVVMNTSSH